MRRALAVSIVILGVALTWIDARPAFADDLEGNAATKAQALEKSKKPKDAAEQWEKAFETSKDPSHLFRAARDRQKGGDPAGAANDYGRFVAALKPTDKEHKKEKAIAAKELGTLNKTLGRFALRATGSTKISVDGYPVELSRAEEWYVTPGAHVVEAKFETGVGKETATAEKGKLVPVVIAAPIEGEGGATPPTKPEDKPPEDKPGSDSGSKPPVAVSGRTGEKFSLPPFWFYVLGGVTVVVGGITVLSALDVQSQKSTFDKEKTQQNLEDGQSKQTRTNILLVSTGVLVAASAVTALVLVDWRRSDTRIGIGPGSFYLTKTF